MLPGAFWHYTSDDSTNLLFNNVYFGQGRLESLSLIRRTYGERFITLGDLYPMLGATTEATWEAVRLEHHPEKPSRSGALFLFEERRAAEAAAYNWKTESPQRVLEARILKRSNVHRGHLGWFCVDMVPEKAAARYWSGEACAEAAGDWELVVDGEIYFPDWRNPPFGPFGKHRREQAQSPPAR